MSSTDSSRLLSGDAGAPLAANMVPPETAASGTGAGHAAGPPHGAHGQSLGIQGRAADAADASDSDGEATSLKASSNFSVGLSVRYPGTRAWVRASWLTALLGRHGP